MDEKTVLPTPPISVSNVDAVQEAQPHYLEYAHSVGGLGNNLLGLVSVYVIAAILNYTLVCNGYLDVFT